MGASHGFVSTCGNHDPERPCLAGGRQPRAVDRFAALRRSATRSDPGSRSREAVAAKADEAAAQRGDRSHGGRPAANGGQVFGR